MSHFVQKDIAKKRVMIDLRSIRVAGISTNAFIFNKQLKTDSLTTDGGRLGLLQSKKAPGKKEIIEIDNDFFDEAHVKNIRMGSTDFLLYNKDEKNAAPFSLKNVKFNASEIDSTYAGTDVMQLIGNSN